MKIRSLILICTLTLLCSCRAATAASTASQEMLESANAAFSSGDYAAATRQYREILATYGLSPTVLHDLGNSYLAAGETGRAILQYMRGLRLDPGDADLAAELALARKQHGLYAGEKGPVATFFELLDMNQWLLAALAAYLLFTLVAAIRLIRPQARWPTALAALFAAVVLTALLGAWQQQARWGGSIVVEPGARLLLSPFETSAAVGALEEGTMVFSEKEHAGFAYVRDEHGRKGWLPKRMFEQIPTDRLRYGREPAAPGPQPR